MTYFRLFVRCLNPGWHRGTILRLPGAAAVAIVHLALLAPPPAARAQDTQPAAVDLRAVLDSVFAHHPLVRASAARVRAAVGARRSAGVFGNPIASYNLENVPFPGGGNDLALDREQMTTVMLPLEALYQRRPRVRRANAEVRATRADAALANQRIALDAIDAFYRTAAAQVRVDAARDLVSWLDTVVIYNRARVKEGATAEADLIRAELERDRTSAEEAMREAELVQARSLLASFIGTPVSVYLRVTVADAPLPLATNEAVQPVLESPERHAARALRVSSLVTRPDVRAATERVTASSAGLTGQKSMFIRQFGVTFGTKQMMGSSSMIAGLSLPIPLFDQNRGEVARASAEADAARFELQAITRAAEAELLGAVEAARLLSNRAGSVAGPGSAYLARADEARRIALGAYREGAVPLLQVIDAARAWGEARVGFFELLFAQHRSVFEMLAAQGADLRSPLMTMPTAPSPRE